MIASTALLTAYPYRLSLRADNGVPRGPLKATPNFPHASFVLAGKSLQTAGK